MKVAAAVILFTASCSAVADHVLDYHELRFGSLYVDRPDGDNWSGGTTLKFEGTSLLQSDHYLSIYDTLEIGAADYAVIFDGTREAPCPGKFLILEVTATLVKSFKPFGTCSDRVHAKAVGTSIEVRMPLYIPDADSWEKKDLAEAENTTMLYIFEAGSLVERKESGKFQDN